MGNSSIRGLLALGLISLSLAKPVYRRQNGSIPMIDTFEQLTSSPDFQWTPCFEKFTCTLLQVPLDYDNEAAGTANIAFMKWTTNSSTATNSSAQDVLINPGGPGSGGVFWLENSLDGLLDILGTDNNIVAFDPRGTGSSGPDTSCFPGKSRTITLYDEDLFDPVDADDDKSLAETFANAGAFGEWCTAVHSSANSSVKYINTVATATDMLHYTELLAKSKGQNPEESQLWYYGVSYGTVLGSTFATLFPDRVGRLVLDGVVDGEDYWEGKWAANLPDADENFNTFFKYCYEAGEGGACEFWAESPEAIKARFDAVVDDIEAKPYHLQIPYQPLDTFPILSRIMTELEQRNADLVIALAGIGRQGDQCNLPPGNANFGNSEPRQFIACIDGNGRFNLSTFESWKEHVKYLVDQSKYLGEGWAAGTTVNCRSLNIRAPENQMLKDWPSAEKTSNPILFLSSTLDPVTPLRAAEKMTARFGGSRLLVQDNEGHCVISSPSNCTSGYVHQYFKDASLPAEGTICESNFVPFKGGTTLPPARNILPPMGDLLKNALALELL